MSNADGANWPLRGNQEMVQVSIADYQSRSDIPDVYSLQQTTPEHSEGESGVERSYFDEDVVKKTICGVSPTAFWILLAVVLALLVAGAIGGVTAAVEINKQRDSAR